MRESRKQGFTLIEIMVVVAVILLLSGMMFRVGNMVNDRSKRAKALGEMQMIANALEEYYAVYGSYPPVSRTRYTYADPGLRPEIMGGMVRNSDHQDGLVAYLYGRGQLDTMQDVPSEVRSRWSHHLADLSTGGSTPEAEWEIEGEGTFVYSNRTQTISGPFGEYQYSSQAPYLSYELSTSVPGSSERLSVSSGGQ